MDDLAADAVQIGDREVTSIFIGGGTPSLFSAEAVATLLGGIKQRVNLAAQAEITLEANPGTLESERFTGFRQAGVNRISIGVQSFQSAQLSALGRIHDSQQAQHAASYARAADLNSFNLDLMHGLPDQSVEHALQDLQQAIAQSPPHLSWYQLTIEPNTQFASRPPKLPDDDILWEIQSLGHQKLKQAGYQQYEISAYSQPGHQCQHNLNYWRFGDYLGIGCGAHGKITDATTGKITRTVKVKHPRGYMDMGRDYLDQRKAVEAEDLPFEFFMNRFRLAEPCPVDDYQALTHQPLDDRLRHTLEQAQQKGLLDISDEYWQVTPQGHRYLNDLLGLFV